MAKILLARQRPLRGRWVEPPISGNHGPYTGKIAGGQWGQWWAMAGFNCDVAHIADRRGQLEPFISKWNRVTLLFRVLDVVAPV